MPLPIKYDSCDPVIFDIYAQKRSRLKETEGARANMAALKDLLKTGK